MNYELTTATEQQQFYELYLYAFNKEDSQQRRDFFFYRYDQALTYGIKANDQLVSALYAIPLTVGFQSATYSMHGIGDVMSAPEYSGRGGAGNLLRYALEKMAQQKVALSYLAPFSFTYYRKFGYEHVFDKIHYQISADKLRQFQIPKVTCGHLQKGALIDFIAIIDPLYKNSPLANNGGIIRSKNWWHYLTLKNSWDVAVYYDDNAVAQGYLLYERSGLTLTIKEFVYQTSIAKNALLTFISKHQNSFTTIIYEAPNLDYLGLFTSDPYLFEAKIVPYMMARIVDLKSFFDSYPFAGNLDICLELSDPVLSQNTGIWRLQAKDGVTSLVKTSAKAQLTLTIQQLSQIFLGATSASRLAKLGQIKVADKIVLTKLDAALSAVMPTLVDYF